MSNALPHLIAASEDAPAVQALVVALLGALFVAVSFLSVIGYQVHRVLRSRPFSQGDEEEAGSSLSESNKGVNHDIEEEKICQYDSSGCSACVRCVECDLPVCTLYAEGEYCRGCIQAVSPVGVLCQYIQCRGPAERFCATCGTPVCGDHTEGDYCGNCIHETVSGE